MAENPLNIDSFELLLQQQSSKKPSKLYGDTPRQLSSSRSLYTANDVITNVTNTIRTMRNADVVRYDKKTRIKLAHCKKSQFLSVSMLIDSREEPKPDAAAKFDTQCVTDTQLIDVIDKAEVIDAEQGMTQEFETTFCCPMEETAGCSKDETENSKKPASVTGINEIIKSPETSENFQSLAGDDIVKENYSKEAVLKTNKPQNQNSQTLDGIIETVNLENTHSTEIKDTKGILKDKETLTRNKTELLDESIEIETSLENLGALIEEAIERSESPVLKTNLSTKMLAISQHLVVDLEEFENFERAAALMLMSEDANKEVRPQTEINKLDDAKEITKTKSPSSGKLFENDDCIETIESGNFVIEKDIEMSQILTTKTIPTANTNAKTKEMLDSTEIEQITKTNEVFDKPVQRDKVETIAYYEESLKTDDFETVQNVTPPLLSSKSVTSDIQLKDEILFSSDEEEDYIHKEFQELPFTCALETSFYNNQSDILDKTMFVGFQTASNKFIQISVDSYDLAKSVLEPVSLKDLVEKCSGNMQIEKDTDDDCLIDIKVNKHTVSDNDVVIPKEVMLSAVNNYAISDLEQELPMDDNSINIQDDSKENANVETMDREKNTFKDIDLSDIFEAEIKNMPQEKEIVEPVLNLTKEIPSLIENQHFVGFKTANNKNISISKKAMENCRKVFQDIEKLGDESILVLTDLIEPLKTKQKPLPNTSKDVFTNVIPNNINQRNLKCFTTASNKKITISDEALAKSMNLFQDLDLSEEFDKEIAVADDSKAETIVNNNVKTCETINKVNDALIEAVSKPAFAGFKTASNKHIDISKQALAKSMKVFQNTGTGDTIENAMAQSFGGFKTASNKYIQISDKGLAKSKNLFQDIDLSGGFDEEIALPEDGTAETNVDDKMNVSETVNEVNDALVEAVSKPAFVGFKTASNKNINISKQALEKSMKVFQDTVTSTSLNYATETAKAQRCGGFKTAINKNIHVSEKALAKTKLRKKALAIFQDIDKIDTNDAEQPSSARNPDEEFKEKGLNFSISPKFVGFQTASKKPVTILKEAFETTKSIFQEIDKFDGKSFNDAIAKNVIPFKGFQTASKKPVSISEAALKRTKHIFQDIGSIKNITNNIEIAEDISKGYRSASKEPMLISKEGLDQSNIEYQDNYRNKENHTFQGFMTASNKKVEISKEAVEKSKKLFEDITPFNTANEEKHSFEGFKTASNKRVEISKEAIEKSKKLLGDITESNSTDATVFEAFQPASNTVVPINQDCLEEAKHLLNHMNVTESKSMNFPGFQTASNKTVKVSAEAFAKTRNIFQDIDLNDGKTFDSFKTTDKEGNDAKEFAETNELSNDIEKEKDLPAKKAYFKGFQTASKKKVQISEDALAKSKGIFKDMDKSQTMREPRIDNFTKASCSNESLDPSKNAFAYTTNVKCFNMKSDKNTPNQKKSESIEVELDKIIDTQVLNNFDEALNTEDFCPKTPTSLVEKRSGSPILSCPKAKKRKTFKTPYRMDTKVEKLKKHDKVGEIHKGKLEFDKEYKRHRYYILKDLQLLETNSKDQAKTDPYLTNLSFDSLLKFEFVGRRNNIDSKEKLNTDDIRNYFEESVDRKIIPKGWFEIHMKLILWKLISYELRFPKIMGYSCNAKTVIDQLKYRYDRELYKVERPALRKILEKDDVSARTLVLCVVSIFEDSQNVASVTNLNVNIELLVSDGWYYVRASLDKMLSKLVFDGKITVGSKIVTHGAELTNCDQGIAPWEDTSAVRLKLFGNSTRRAKWDARLGYHGNAAAILSRLSNVRLDGGKVAKIRVLVTRVYPLLYVEKFEDGSTVTRSERLEQIYQTKYESDRQIQLEKLYEDVEKEFYDEQESQDSDPELGSGKRRSMESGSQIAKMMKRSRDPMEFRASLTSSQQARLADHSAKTRDRLLSAIQERVQQRMVEAGLAVPRHVVPLLKIRVADGCKDGGVTKGLLSIWRPNDAILEFLQEGAWIDVMDVVPTALRYSELQLTAGRQSTFDRAKVKETEKLKALTKSLNRICYCIKDLHQNSNLTTDYNEIDTVGIVFAIEPSKIDFETESNKNRNLFQNVYLTDAEMNFLCVNFWGGVKKFGFENILDTGQVIAGTNLQKRAGNTRKNIPQYRATEFTYFTKTPKNATARDMVEELVKKMNGIDSRKFCQDCLELKNKMASAKCHNNVENVTPYRFHNADFNLSKNKIFIDSPLVQKPVQRKDLEDLNLTGLDFESTFKQKDTQDMSPELLKRKQKVRDKLAKLKMYGEPPPLSPIYIINKSKNADNGYRSPLAANLPQESPKTSARIGNYQNGVGVASAKTQNTVANNSTNITRSSVLNRTYVKTMNPVKLNFSNTNNNESVETVDHFAEEFDDSPPLSLD